MGNIQCRKVGKFMEIECDDGDLKRMYATGEKVSVRRLFVELDDITSVTCKAHDNDVVITLKNGCEYLLDELDDATETYGVICRYIVEDEYD